MLSGPHVTSEECVSLVVHLVCFLDLMLHQRRVPGVFLNLRQFNVWLHVTDETHAYKWDARWHRLVAALTG